MSDPIQTSPDIELPEGLWETAIAAKYAVTIRTITRPSTA